MIIEFKNLKKRFGERTILNSISFSIHKGEIVFILGQSGTGKSVLLKNIVGLMKPEEGEIYLSGQNITSFTEKQMQEIRKKCGAFSETVSTFVRARQRR